MKKSNLKSLRNERGIALVTALLLTLISLTIILAVLYYISRSTELSAMHKRYKNALEASHGGVDVVTTQVIPQVFTGQSIATLQTNLSSIGLFVPYTSCMKDKVTKATFNWRASCSTSLDPKSSADLSFVLQGLTLQDNYIIYAKIVDTAPGNTNLSGSGGLLDVGSSVTGGGDGAITPVHLPSRYRIEIQGEKQNNNKEKAQLTVLYAY